MGTHDFLSWIKRGWGKLNKFIHFGIMVIIGAIINEIPRICGEEIMLRIILQFLSNIWEGAKPIAIQYWLTKPYLFELAIFLIALFFLLLWAFIKTQPPKGIEILSAGGNNVQIVVMNSTGYKLINCYLQIRKVETRKGDGVLFCWVFPFLPFKCMFLDEKGEWVGYGSTEIDHADRQFFKVADIMESPDLAKFTVWEKPTSYKYFYFEGKVKLECKFIGTTPDGQVKEKNFELRIHTKKLNLVVDKVWQ